MDITLLKKHLYLDHDLDDDLLNNYVLVAEAAISEYIGGEYDETNKLHYHALFFLVSDWYKYRESTVALTINELQTGVRFLLDMAIQKVAI